MFEEMKVPTLAVVSELFVDFFPNINLIIVSRVSQCVSGGKHVIFCL